eukprot:CAMPEP_0171622674 /NCGR_PEP_ID=MMETSP0990-20121206/17414_1 /TAXON_ID=483369 /ORGANISM="non described non described, Strain CCMP2098" /LENGTH=179 /DNA_ID=CAMNT_0012188577 /DNA_START=11 /DNA_END=550 /DNA_ORIENTATION=-
MDLARRSGGARRTRTNSGVRTRTGTNELNHRETESDDYCEMNGGSQIRPLDPDDGPRVFPSSTPLEQKHSAEQLKVKVDHDSGNFQRAPFISKSSGRGWSNSCKNKTSYSSFREPPVEVIEEGSEDERKDDVPDASMGLQRTTGVSSSGNRGSGWLSSKSRSIEDVEEGSEDEHKIELK